jgi:hypothetical protein
VGALKALGGAPLVGDCWVRILYLDESGIGNIKSDPILVVAGVIIHADTQWGAIQGRLDDLLTEMTPMGAKKPSYFHAKDVYHGSGEFPRNTWEEIRRNSLLRAVGEIVDEFKQSAEGAAAPLSSSRNEGTHPQRRARDLVEPRSPTEFVGRFPHQIRGWLIQAGR